MGRESTIPDCRSLCLTADKLIGCDPKQALLLMMELTRKSCVLCFGILLSFALTGGGQPTVMLCLGEDGHIAIEASDSECCSESHLSHYRATHLVSTDRELPSKNDCGACIDIPISIGYAALVKEPCQVDRALPAPVAPAIVNSADFSEYQPDSESLAPAPYFSPLRAIILLI